MLAAPSLNGLPGGIVRAVSGIGRLIASAFSAEPAPYWTDYLRETDRPGH